jgi:soluble lytic murein transglycosylase-like protein
MATTDYRAHIERAAAVHQLDPDVIEALVLVESSGHADAFRYEPDFWRRYMQGKSQWEHAIPRRVSSSYGLMQIMYPVAWELGFRGEPEELFVPERNLGYGCLKFSRLMDWAKDDVEQALAAYNGGKRGNSVRPFRTATYAAKVLKRKDYMVGLV